VTVVARQRRRLEPDTRRAQILAVAVRLFGERGHADVSTGDVATGAGVARGLVNHYFGTKKDLYLEVVRVMLTVPEMALTRLPEAGPAARAAAIVSWFLDVVSRHSTSWLFAITAGGMSGDADVDAVIAEAVDGAADRVLTAMGLPTGGPAHAIARSYVGLATSTAREWLERGELTREQVHRLLTATLLTMADQALLEA
jgi:AcrR family transcriptional regulator